MKLRGISQQSAILGSFFSLMRPQQWVKNLFVLLPLFFGGQGLNLSYWREGMLSFAAFSLMASAVYCFNDMRDLEKDRQHPKKKNRPLPSGKLKSIHAVVLMIILILMSITLTSFLSYNSPYTVSIILFLYLLLNIGYSVKLKDYAVIDVLCIASGFILRLAAGSVACKINLSSWIVIITFLLALFLALAKRHEEIIMYEKNDACNRDVCKKYNLHYINRSLTIIGAIIIACYIMFCVSQEAITQFNNKPLYITTVFVIAAILRYLRITIISDKHNSNPSIVLYRDRFIQICITLWISTFSILIYL